MYQWLVDHTTGGRMWTYVTREWTHRNPRVTMVLAPAVLVIDFAGVVAAIALLPWWSAMLVAWVNTGLGVIVGHIWWDTQGAYLKDPRKRDS